LLQKISESKAERKLFFRKASLWAKNGTAGLRYTGFTPEDNYRLKAVVFRMKKELPDLYRIR